MSFLPLSLRVAANVKSGASTLAALMLAQTAGAASASTKENLRSDTPTEDQEVTTLEKMVVQGRQEQLLSSPKFTQPLVDTPQTITVIPRAVIEQQNATTLREVLRNTPGITFQAGEGGTTNGDQMTIRGFDARTDISVDGVRDAGTYTRDAFNLEQVEVAKGPSSANSGRGSTGASVNLVSKTPHLGSFRTGTLGVGNADYRRATLDLNEDLSAHSPIPGTAVRLNAMWQESGVPRRDIVENKQWAVAPSLAFGLRTDTRVTASYLHLEQDNIPDYGVPWVPVINGTTVTGFTPELAPYAGGIPPIDLSNWYGLAARDYEEIENDTATLIVERDLTDDATLRNLTRYGVTERDSLMTAPRFVTTAGIVQPTIRRDDWKSRDQVEDIFANQTNLNLSLNTGPVQHDVSTGLEISRETSDNYARVFPTGTGHPIAILNSPNPYDSFTAQLSRNGAVVSAVADSLGVYLFDTLKLGSRWQLNGGLRWDRFDVDYTSVAALPASTVTRLQRTDEMLSWKTGLVFKPRANGSLYAGYGTAFNPSAEGLTLTAVTALLEPEESRSLEIGTKWEFFGARLATSAALFRTDKINARTTTGLTGAPTELAGDQRVQGIELGISGQVTEAWNLFAGYAYMESEVLDSNNATEIGSALARTPENSFNAWTTYELPFRIVLGAGAQFMDEVDRSTTTLNQITPAYWLYNAMLSYEANQVLTFRLNVNNLSDKAYVDRVGGGHFIPGPGRAIVLTAAFKF